MKCKKSKWPQLPPLAPSILASHPHPWTSHHGDRSIREGKIPPPPPLLRLFLKHALPLMRIFLLFIQALHRFPPLEPCRLCIPRLNLFASLPSINPSNFRFNAQKGVYQGYICNECVRSIIMLLLTHCSACKRISLLSTRNRYLACLLCLTQTTCCRFTHVTHNSHLHPSCIFTFAAVAFCHHRPSFIPIRARHLPRSSYFHRRLPFRSPLNNYVHS